MISLSTRSLPLGGNAPSAGAMTQASKGNPRLYDVPYLEDDGSNFAFWKFRTQTVLGLCDLWTTVNGTITEPAQSAPPEEKDRGSHNYREAHAQITLTFKHEPLHSLLNATPANASCATLPN